MRPIVIGEAEKKSLERIKRYAFTHPLTINELKKLQEKSKTLDSNERALPDEHFTIIPICLEVGVTYEIQPPLRLWHVSFNLTDKDNVFPHPFVVDTILGELGFPSAEKSYSQDICDGKFIHLWFLDQPETTNI